MKRMVVLSLIICSCSKDVTVQKTEQPVSYHYDIQPLLEMYCINCHVAGSSSAELYDYEHVALYAASGELAGCLNGDSNYVQMPPAGANPLDPFQKYSILEWIAQGFDNN
jgi:hypothetical protein